MKRLWTLVFVLLTLPVRAQDDAASGADLYRKGRARLSLTGGFGRAGSANYGIVGLGGGYYWLDGFETGLDGEVWIGEPRIWKISPEMRYVFLTVSPVVQPYVGAFYREILYQGSADFSSIGGRFGLFWPVSRRTAASASLVYERILDCNGQVDSNCSKLYPEAGLTFSF